MQRRVADCTMSRPCGEDYPAFSQRRIKRIDKDEEDGMYERERDENERKERVKAL